MYLFDSNTIIDFLAGAFSPQRMSKLSLILDEGFFISVITKVEVLGFDSKDRDIDLKNELFVGLASVLELNSEIVKETIIIRKTKKLKIPDAIIAATAIVADLTLLTRNTEDFKNIANLSIANPHKL